VALSLVKQGCGCDPQFVPTKGQCGAIVGLSGELAAEAFVVGEEEDPEGGIDRVELHLVTEGDGAEGDGAEGDGAEGDAETLIDFALLPEPGTKTWSVTFDAARTPQGIPGLQGKNSALSLRFKAWRKDGLPPKALDVEARVDGKGPALGFDLENEEEGKPTLVKGDVGFSLTAGVDVSGLTAVAVKVGWVTVATFLPPGDPFGAAIKTEGSLDLSLLPPGPAELVVEARDCAGNMTVVKEDLLMLDVVGDPEKVAVSCYGFKDPPELESLHLGQGDSDDLHPDLLAASNDGVIAAWGLPTVPYFIPLKLVEGTEKCDRAVFIEATGDGVPDVAAMYGFGTEGSITLYEQKTSGAVGTRKFKELETVSLPTAALQLAVADMNNDGLDDLLAASKEDEKAVTILFQRAKGAKGSRFEKPYLLTGTGKLSYMIPVDVDQDGLLDILATRSSEGVVTAYLNIGDGVFSMAHDTLTLDKAVPYLSAGDFDEDGFPDTAVFLPGLKSTCELNGKGDGYFDALDLGSEGPSCFCRSNTSRIVLPSWTDGTLAEAGALVNCNEASNSAQVGDFNLDGHLDLAVLDPVGGQVQMFHGLGDGTLRDWYFLPAAEEASWLVSGKVNADAIPDLAMLTSETCGVLVILSQQWWSGAEGQACVGQGSCGPGEGQGCDCRCACVCADESCWWDCEWAPAEGACDDEKCPGGEDSGCECKVTANCDAEGKLACTSEWTWDGKANNCPAGTDECDPDIVPPEKCECACPCVCECSATGGLQCGRKCALGYDALPDCPEQEGCNPGTCEGVPVCEGAQGDGQCVCDCDCACACDCECGCGGEVGAWCAQDCEESCSWKCTWVPESFEKPWGRTVHVPMPVNEECSKGRLTPAEVLVEDFNADGVTDVAILSSDTDCWPSCQTPGHRIVRTVHMLDGATQSFEWVDTIVSLTSPDVSGTVVDFVTGYLDSDEYLDLAVAQSSAQEAISIMLGGKRLQEDAYCKPVACCPHPAPVKSGWGFAPAMDIVAPYTPTAIAVSPLNTGDSEWDLLIANKNCGKPSDPQYFPETVGVFLSHEGAPYPLCHDGLAPMPGVCYGNPGCQKQCVEKLEKPQAWGCSANDLLAAPLTGTASSLALADLNLDGTLDVVAANQDSDDLTIMHGTATSDDFLLTSDEFPPGLLSVGDTPLDLTVGDIDEDGLPDFLVALKEKIALAWNIDGKEFTMPKYFSVGSCKPAQVGLGDFTGDGIPDVIAVSGLGGAYVFPGPTGIDMAAAWVFQTGVGPNDLAVGEMNGDKCAELVIVNEKSKTVSVIVNEKCPK